MKSTRPISTRLSALRFSLGSVCSPISPLSPQTPHLANSHTGEQLPSTRQASNTSSSNSFQKEASTNVYVVDGEGAAGSLLTPRALPTPGLSPITPWHATFHRNAASTDQETKYLRQTTNLRHARLALSILLLATGIALTAVESDILSLYKKTNLASSWHLDLWPTDLSLTPTILLLTTGTLTTLLSLLTILGALMPSPNPRIFLNNTLFTALVTLTTPFTLATLIASSATSPAAIFSSFINPTLTSLVTTTGPGNTIGLTVNGASSNPQRETIQSFTCGIANTARAFNRDASTLQLPSFADMKQLVPSEFARVCGESKNGLVLAIVVLGLAGVGCVVSVLSWVVERRIERCRGEREVVASRDRVEGHDGFGGVPYEKSAGVV